MAILLGLGLIPSLMININIGSKQNLNQVPLKCHIQQTAF